MLSKATNDQRGFVNGYKIWKIKLKNKNGMSVSLTNYGGAITNICVPDKNGNIRDVVLGYDRIDGYINGTTFQGALIGRCANRIGGAEFELNGTTYKLSKNDGENSLHGGKFGYNQRVWTIDEEGNNYVTFGYISPDGEENYPGTLHIQCRYTLTDENELKLEYFGECDKDTIVNMTNHTYFNLGGFESGKIFGHVMQIFSDEYTPVSEDLIPTGEIVPVEGTPFDFRKPKEIGKDILEGKIDGYDHNYILSEPEVMKKAAEVYNPESGIKMEVFTDKPAMQFYTGNGLNGETGKNGVKMEPQTAFCLETQYCPDSPNKPQFDSPVLMAGDEYYFTTVYKFSIKA